MNVREPAVAGRFYPAEAKELENDIARYLKKANAKVMELPAALLVPHAGYVFSGQVAAEAFNTISPGKVFKRVFVIGSSHTLHFNGASVYRGSHYKTPLGNLTIDQEVVKELLKESIFDFVYEAHQREHSIEVQMPFIHHLWGEKTPVVPIILGDVSKTEISAVAKVLSVFFNQDNLFIISTDFSHFPKYNDAIEQDNLTADAIAENNPEALEKRLEEAKKSGIADLATPLCGWTSVLTLLNMTTDKPVEYRKLSYRNSGDSHYGNRREVVGYWAMSVEWKNTSKSKFELSENEKNNLLNIARQTLVERLERNRDFEVPEEWMTKNLVTKVGVFVSIYVNDELRGCIGNLHGRKPLYSLVQEMTVSAAKYDDRFKPVLKEELPRMSVEISVLTPMVKISDANEIEPGKHGVYITNGWQKGTLLPQVASRMNWTAEELLGHCARDKAGMTWEGWKNAEVFKYEAIIFKG